MSNRTDLVRLILNDSFQNLTSEVDNADNKGKNTEENAKIQARSIEDDSNSLLPIAPHDNSDSNIRIVIENYPTVRGSNRFLIENYKP